MKKKHQKGKRSNRSFNPDEVSTRLHEAICRDLSRRQVYGGFSPGQEMAMSRQKDEFLKKFLSSEVDSRSLEAEAFLKFREINAYMRRVNQAGIFPQGNNQRLTSDLTFMHKVHLRARALCHFVLHSFSEDEWFFCCKHSGGATVGVPFLDTSWERKFAYPISCTSRAKPMFERYLEYDFQLYSSVKDLNGGVEPEYSFKVGSRATTVEKDNQKRRFICVEPTANMYLQQGLMQMMYHRLEEVGLDVRSLPDRHRYEAWRSSVTGSNATIDWSSASDCVGIELVKWLIPQNWYDALDMVRSPFTVIDDQEVELNMFSSMGNAATFPLETLIFWAYAHAVRLSLNPHTNTLFPDFRDLRKVSVFGDDCIVEASIAEVYITVMESVGFIVNDEKSFYGSERFRESCGGDFSVGYPVRPFNLRAPTDRRISSLEPWLYVILNALLPKYMSYFGELRYIYESSALAYISSLFRRYGLSLRPIPPDFPDDAGIKSSDINRLCWTYGFTIHPIHQSLHGSTEFTFTRFVYSRQEREKLVKDSALRYSLDLKRLWLRGIRESVMEPRLESRQLLTFGRIPRKGKLVEDPFRDHRKIGGYVVAKGVTGHWSVPDMENPAHIHATT